MRDLKQHAFEQNVIALVWDFDKTLISKYMQVPLFEMYDIDDKQFWDEVQGLQEYYAKKDISINQDTVYLNHLLTYVKEGKLKGLNNALLKDLGKKLDFYPGLPEFFPEIKKHIESNPNYKKFGIILEHYIVSTGFAEMIKGSDIAPYVNGIWGCEFIEDPAPIGYLNGVKADNECCISQVASALDNTSKTRFIFEINKGANVVGEIDVNSRMNANDRRVPFENMTYIADGPSDVPAFSILNQAGGYTFAVYPKGDSKALRQVDSLRNDRRVNMYGEADYSKDSMTHMWLFDRVEQIANNIVEHKEALIRKSASRPPKHL